MPEVLDRSVIDEIIAVGDEDALETARLVAQRGGRPRRDLGRRQHPGARCRSPARPEMAGKRVVTIVCDSGERYMSLPFFAP